MEQQEQQGEMVTRNEAAELAGKNPRTIDRWANEGRLTRYKVGKLQWVRFMRDEVLRMVSPAAQEVNRESPAGPGGE